MGKKIGIALGVVVALLLVVAVIGFVLINPQKLVASKKDDVMKSLSEKLGREVTAGEVTAKVGSDLTARIVNVQIAGASGKKPQLEIGSVDMRFSLLRALLSFGNDLHVEKFTVQALTLRAARDGQGRWDFQDILDKTASEEPAAPATPEKKGPSPLEDLRIASLRVINGRIELDDKMLGRPLAVGALNIDTSDIELGKALEVGLKAELEDGGRKAPIDVTTRLAVLPRDLSFDPLPDLDVKAVLTDVDLGPWGGLAPADVPAPVQGTLRTDLVLKASDDASRLTVDGTILTRGLVLRDALSAVADAAERAAAPRGLPLDADIAVSLAVDQKKPRYEVKKLTLKGNGLDLNATIDASGTSLAALEKADVQATATDLNRVISVLPPSLRGLPPELKIEGPLSAKLTGTAAEIDANVNLDNARVRFLDVPEGGTAATATAALFDKPAARPLNLTLHGKRGASALDIDRFALVVDTAKIGGTLSLPTAAGAPLAADIASGPVELVSLQGLVPPFKDAIGRGQKVAGQVEVKVKATSTDGKQVADAAVELRSMDVNLSATTVRGSGALTVKAAPAGDVVDLVTTANFDGLSIQKMGEGGELVVNKPAGLPLRLDVSAKKAKDRADVSVLKLAIGKSTVNGTGSITALDKESPRLDVDLGQVALGFDDLRTAIPGASRLPAGGRLTGNVKLAGGTSANALVVDAKQMNVTFGTTRIAGDVNVKNLSDPVLDVNLATVDLAFDDVRKVSESAGDLPAGGRFKGTVKMSGDTAKSATVKAHVKIESLTAQGSTLKGAIQIENLDKPRFELGLQADTLDIDKLRGDTSASSDKSAPKGPRENPHGLSKSTRAMLADVNGKGTVTATRAVVKGIPVQNFKGTLVMTRGVARFDTLEFGLYGGTVTANGTTLDLPAERTGYDLRLKGKDIDLGAAVADQTDLGKIFTGRVSPDMNVKGKGIAPRDFAITAEGPAELKFKSLSISTLDLLGPIGEAVNKTGKVPGYKLAIASPDGTALEGFTALTKFIGGKLRLEKPVETNSSIGKIQWEGAAGLDAGLDLKATVNLTPTAISKLSGGKLKVKNPIPVPLKVGGTWDKPRVGGVDVGPLVVAILKEVGGSAAKDVATDAAKGVLDSVTGKKDDKKGGKKDDKKGGKSTTDKAVDAAKGFFGK